MFWGRGFSRREQVMFLTQLRTLLQAHVSIHLAMEWLMSLSLSRKLSRLGLEVRGELEAGYSLSQALEKKTYGFDPVALALLRIGELSGKLGEMIGQWLQYRSEIDQLRDRVIKAISYPMTVLVVAAIVIVVFLVHVLPTVEGFFASFDAPLPRLTRAVMALSRILRHDGWLLGIIAIGGAIRIRYCYRCLWGIRSIVDAFFLALFSTTLSLLLSSGVPLLESLAALDARGFEEHFVIRQLLSDLREGQGLSPAMRSTSRFPAWVVQQVALGESTGTLGERLHAIGKCYWTQIADRLESLTRWMEPIIMIALSLGIGGILVAMYLPMVQLGTVV